LVNSKFRNWSLS